MFEFDGVQDISVIRISQTEAATKVLTGGIEFSGWKSENATCTMKHDITPVIDGYYTMYCSNTNAQKLYLQSVEVVDLVGNNLSGSQLSEIGDVEFLRSG
jgi:hypothetical protein